MSGINRFGAFTIEEQNQNEVEDDCRPTNDQTNTTDTSVNAVQSGKAGLGLGTTNNDAASHLDNLKATTPAWRRNADARLPFTNDNSYPSNLSTLAAHTKQWRERDTGHTTKPPTPFHSNLPFGTGSFATTKRAARNGWPDRGDSRADFPATSAALLHDTTSLRPSQIALKAQGKFNERPTLQKNPTWLGSAVEDEGTYDMTAEASTTTKARYNSFPHTNADQRKYNPRYTPPRLEKTTGNGKPWSNFRRGIIVEAIDSGRLYTGQLAPNSQSDVVEIKSRKRMFKARFWLIVDKLEDHALAKPICTHNGAGLEYQPESIRKDSMCIFPFDEAKQEGWVNEVPENEVLFLKAQHGGVPISARASVRASQCMMLDREEDFHIVAEMAESEVAKVDALEWKLRVESREQA